MKNQIKSVHGNVIFEYGTKADLRGADLREADLRKANFQEANLRWVDLREANLQEANLRLINLQEADLREADLRKADLRKADLRKADLRWADLRGADLQGADLREVDLRFINLRGANLRWADLREVDLQGADLREVDLQGAKNIDKSSLWFNQTRILPEGDIIGYKKCNANIIVKLLIPTSSKRSHSFGRKCRAEYAKVLSISDGSNIARSKHDLDFTYKVGDIVKPKYDFSEDWVNECSSGIHFFITRKEAEEY